jgi:hypothetical protein
MHGKRGGQAIARHASHHLRSISPMGVRASIIARERWKAREAYERGRSRGVPLPVSPRPTYFLYL